MASVIPEGLDPLGTWDAHSPNWADVLVLERIEWARRHIPRVNETCRAEFYMIDMPFAVLYRHLLDGNGKVYLDPVTGTAAQEDPVILPLDELPPARLLRFGADVADPVEP